MSTQAGKSQKARIYYNNKVSELCIALDCTPGLVIAALTDCGMECSQNAGRRKALHDKLDHVLQRVNSAHKKAGW